MVRRSGARSWVVVVVSGLVVLVVSAGVAGCGGEPEPRFAPAPSTSAPVTSSAVPTASASTQSAPAGESPEDFIRRWFSAYTDMQNSGDAAAYRAMTEGCGACDRVALTVERYYDRGGYFRSGGTTVDSVRRKATDGTTSVYTVSVTATPTEFTRRAGGPVDTFDGGAQVFELTVGRSGDGYVIRALTGVAE